MGVPAWQKATPDSLVQILRMLTTAALASVQGGDAPYNLFPQVGQRADFVLLRGLLSAHEVVLAPNSGAGRTTVKGGRVVARTTTSRWIASR